MATNLRRKKENLRLAALGGGVIVSIIMTGGCINKGRAETISDADIAAMIEIHCASCHAENPAHPAYIAPASDLVLDSLDAVLENADSVYLQTVDSDIMPLGNETGMSNDERAALGAWIDARLGRAP